ncbi:MAG TPA: hypothetical protein VFV57_05680 [Limnobacter sp.]|nr:hypothetical protein [Limnobacter sp.]
MSKSQKEDQWDSRALGASLEHARVPIEHDKVAKAIDDGLELQMISIRLPKKLIEEFKLIAHVHGLGYQPLMRIALSRFAECEIKQILTEVAEKQSAGQQILKPLKDAA